VVSRWGTGRKGNGEGAAELGRGDSRWPILGQVQMCGKWYRGTLDRDGGEFDSEDEEKAAPVCQGEGGLGVAGYVTV
jgi:hypothetical protein